MTVTPRTEPGSPTYAKKWWWDVNIGTHEAPDWLEIGSFNNFNMEINPTTKDNSTYQSGKWGSDVTTKLKYALNAKFIRNTLPTDPSAYDPGQEVMREYGFLTGPAGRVETRWYEMDDEGPREEAYQGYQTVQWKPDPGADDDLSTVSVVCPGQGTPEPIAHPSPNS